MLAFSQTMPVERARSGKREIEFVCSTVAGPRKEVDEDWCEVFVPDEDVAESRGILAVVADGMGGCVSGEMASKIAAAAVDQGYYTSGEFPQQALANALMDAHQAISASAMLNPGLHGMGSTCAALVIRGAEAFGAHVGDSRICLIRDGALRRLTDDQSFVMAMVQRGIITEEQAAKHPERNILLYVLGHKKEPKVMAWDAPLGIQAGDCFLLCTDGVHSQIAAADIVETLAQTLDLEAASHRLLELVRERGGHDDASVVLVRVLD